ncbi:MAG: aldehyde dehydrogenase family protein [Ignavibacteria bacterium]|nr:aldehyde dehydrogenase family protein [Ignavibacteria bacterium]
MLHIGFIINGNIILTSKKMNVKSKSNHQVFATCSLSFENDVENAIASAYNAFNVTKKLPAYKRKEILQKISEALLIHKEELANLISIETGKPIKLSRIEIDRAINTFQFAAEEVDKITGEVLTLDVTAQSENRFGITKRFPIGPVLAITPFNFPVNLAAHKIAPAIAVGNPIIFKPATAAMVSGNKLASIINDVAMIPGLINSINCSGSVIENFLNDDRIKKISFTGSCEIGWRIKQKAVKQKVTLELGGNAGVMVDKDADLNFAIPRLVTGAFAHAGQICISVQRIFVHREIYEKFLEQFVEETKKVKMGDPLDNDVIVGPMITENDAKRIEEWVNEAKQQGAKILIGGTRKGEFYTPTVLTNTKPEMKINALEAFAPIVTIESVESFEEGIAQINYSKYGLQAGIFTNNLKNALYAFENVEVGGLMINDYPTFRVDNMPYGGVKESGIGREGLKYAIEEMTELKLAVFNKI